MIALSAQERALLDQLMSGAGRDIVRARSEMFTRFWAAAAAIEMLIITCIYWNTGFAWLQRGYEYTLLWGLVCFAVALRGGGPYSLDRKIGMQL